MLTIAIPALEEMHSDGEDGRKKITQITRYTTVRLALIESIAMTIGFGRSGLLEEFNVITVIVALVAGSTMLMWIGERITEKGVGNGISIVLMVNILSSIPSDFVVSTVCLSKERRLREELLKSFEIASYSMIKSWRYICLRQMS